MNLDGKWGVICSDGWDLREANVACGQLGLDFAANAYGVSKCSYTSSKLLTIAEEPRKMAVESSKLLKTLSSWAFNFIPQFCHKYPA